MLLVRGQKNVMLNGVKQLIADWYIGDVQIAIRCFAIA